jgi:mRNA interferase MazF
MAARIARGDVRLYQFARPDKKRPVVVLTRGSAISYLSTVTVAPITSTIRGVPSEVVLNDEDGMKAPCAVNLHNAVTISQERLGRRVAQLGALRMAEICAALRFSLGCDASAQEPEANEIIGIARNAPSDLSTNPRHMKGFGKK